MHAPPYAPPQGPPQATHDTAFAPSPAAYAPNGSIVQTGPGGYPAGDYAPYGGGGGVPTAYDAPPPQEPLPSYTDTVRLSIENSLMPIFSVMQVICIIFAAILFVAHLFNSSVIRDETNAVQYVCVAIFAVCFLIHIFVVVAGYNMRGRRKVPILVTTSITLAGIAQIISIAQLYARKDAAVVQCLRDNDIPPSEYHQPAGSESLSPWDQCHSVWEGYAVWNIVWLVAIVLIGPVFVLVAFKCDAREKRVAESNAFAAQGEPGLGTEAYAMSAVPPYDPSTDPLSREERELADAKLDYPDHDYPDHDYPDHDYTHHDHQAASSNR